MAQFARPTGDLDNTGSWQNEVPASSPLWDRLDDGASADGVVVTSDSTPVVTEPFTVDLGSTITDPGVGTGHILRIRWAKAAGGGGAKTIRIELREGYVNESSQGSLRATDDYSLNSTTLQDDETALSEAEANAITDYTDLQIRVMGVASNRALQVDFVELEAPDGPTELVGTAETVVEATGSATLLVKPAGQAETVVETAGIASQTHHMVGEVATAVAVTSVLGQQARIAGEVQVAAQVAATAKQIHELTCGTAAGGGFSSGFSSGFDVGSTAACVGVAVEVAGTLTVTSGAVELVGQVESAVEATGRLFQAHAVAVTVESVVEVDGSTLTVTGVTTDFVGWGIPAGVT